MDKPIATAWVNRDTGISDWMNVSLKAGEVVYVCADMGSERVSIFKEPPPHPVAYGQRIVSSRDTQKFRVLWHGGSGNFGMSLTPIADAARIAMGA